MQGFSPVQPLVYTDLIISTIVDPSVAFIVCVVYTDLIISTIVDSLFRANALS